MKIYRLKCCQNTDASYIDTLESFTLTIMSVSEPPLWPFNLSNDTGINNAQALLSTPLPAPNTLPPHTRPISVPTSSLSSSSAQQSSWSAAQQISPGGNPYMNHVSNGADVLWPFQAQSHSTNVSPANTNTDAVQFAATALNNGIVVQPNATQGKPGPWEKRIFGLKAWVFYAIVGVTIVIIIATILYFRWSRRSSTINSNSVTLSLPSNDQRSGQNHVDSGGTWSRKNEAPSKQSLPSTNIASPGYQPPPPPNIPQPRRVQFANPIESTPSYNTPQGRSAAPQSMYSSAPPIPTISPLPPPPPPTPHQLTPPPQPQQPPPPQQAQQPYNYMMQPQAYYPVQMQTGYNTWPAQAQQQQLGPVQNMIYTQPQPVSNAPAVATMSQPPVQPPPPPPIPTSPFANLNNTIQGNDVNHAVQSSQSSLPPQATSSPFAFTQQQQPLTQVKDQPSSNGTTSSVPQ